jgi:hypothetical protein
MKTIFDHETEIGQADPERWGWEGGDVPNFELLNGQVMAHTRADLNGARGVLKLEQRVYIRAGEHVLEQNWIHPEMLIESVEDDDADGEKALGLARALHEKFCENARQRLSEGVCTLI